MYALPSILLYTCSVRKLVECFIGPLPWGTSPVPADSQSALVLARGEPHPCVQSEANFLASALATPGGWCVAIQLAWRSLHTIWFLIQRHQKGLESELAVTSTMSLWFSFPELEPPTMSCQADKFPRSGFYMFSQSFVLGPYFAARCSISIASSPSSVFGWASPSEFGCTLINCSKLSFSYEQFGMSRPLNGHDENEWHCQAWQRLTGLELPLYLVETRRKHSACHLVHARHIASFLPPPTSEKTAAPLDGSIFGWFQDEQNLCLTANAKELVAAFLKRGIDVQCSLAEPRIAHWLLDPDDKQNVAIASLAAACQISLESNGATLVGNSSSLSAVLRARLASSWPEAFVVLPLLAELLRRLGRQQLLGSFWWIEMPLATVLAWMEHFGIGCQTRDPNHTRCHVLYKMAAIQENVKKVVGRQVPIELQRRRGTCTLWRSPYSSAERSTDASQSEWQALLQISTRAAEAIVAKSSCELDPGISTTGSRGQAHRNNSALSRSTTNGAFVSFVCWNPGGIQQPTMHWSSLFAAAYSDRFRADCYCDWSVGNRNRSGVEKPRSFVCWSRADALSISFSDVIKLLTDIYDLTELNWHFFCCATFLLCNIMQLSVRFYYNHIQSLNIQIGISRS